MTLASAAKASKAQGEKRNEGPGGVHDREGNDSDAGRSHSIQLHVFLAWPSPRRAMERR